MSGHEPLARDEPPIVLLAVACDDGRGNYWARTFTRPLLQAGALPLILPGLDDPETRAVALDRADAVLIGGGLDIEPAHVDQENADLLWDLDPRRDRIELGLVREAVARAIPVFGTCRGMQVINVALGGSLYLDASLHPGAEGHLQSPTAEFDLHVRRELAGGTEREAFATHRVAFAAGSILGGIYGNAAELNSYHHQHLKALGTNIRATGWSDDGVIEAIELERGDSVAIGVQWEMQLAWREDPRHYRLFEVLVETARTARARRRARSDGPSDSTAGKIGTVQTANLRG